MTIARSRICGSSTGATSSVVLNERALCNAEVRPEQLAEIGEPNLATLERAASRCRRRRESPIGISRLPHWLQSWRARAVARRALDRHVVQLETGRDAAKHQSSAAHVATSDEMMRKQELPSEDREQQVDVLAGCDAAEQHDLAVRSYRRSKVLARRARAVAGTADFRCRFSHPRMRETMRPSYECRRRAGRRSALSRARLPPSRDRPGSGGRANRLAYASLPRKYRPLTKLKTSPSVAPLRLRRSRATANCAFGDSMSCARRPEQLAGDKRKMRGECFGRRRAIVTRGTGGWPRPSTQQSRNGIAAITTTASVNTATNSQSPAAGPTFLRSRDVRAAPYSCRSPSRRSRTGRR